MDKPKIGRPPRSLDEPFEYKGPDGKPVKGTLGERILSVVRMGNFPLTAARACGLSATTWYEWLRLGKQGEEPFATFAHAVQCAEHEAQAVAVASIMAAGQDPRHWTARAWFLERKFPEQFGQTVKVQQQVQHEIDGVLERLKQNLSPEEYRRVLTIIADGEGGEASAEDSRGQ